MDPVKKWIFHGNGATSMPALFDMDAAWRSDICQENRWSK
jgi:hypothetical protein